MRTQLALDSSIDLHMHTTFSDGRWPAEELLDHLAQQGFDLVAVTDHDQIETVPFVQQLGEQRHLSILAGVEMSTAWHGKMGDMLCYGFDPQNEELRALANRVRQGQHANAEEVYEELLRQGYSFPRREEVLASKGGELRRINDCVSLLMAHGYVTNWRAALEKLHEAGYHPTKVDMAETVEIVHRSGGVALIAHPGRGESEPQDFTLYTTELLDQVRAEIPLDGIEVYHPTHTPEHVEAYLDYIQQHDLLMSAGSDSHGPPGRLPMKHRAELCRGLFERVGITVQ